MADLQTTFSQINESASTPEQPRISQDERKERQLKKAMGPLRGLFIGIDNYNEALGFPVLKTCANDATAVRNRFRDVRQLQADRNNLVLLTSGDATSLAIMGALKRLAGAATKDDRLLLYYSGHGQRISDKFYLVPQDAYNPCDEDSLLCWERVASIIDDSAAKEKIIILDACYSGAAKSNSKMLAATMGRKEWIKYVAETTGTLTISSSPAARPSSTLSPNPELSLFTYCLIKGLEGYQSALDDKSMLTSHSLGAFLTTEVPLIAKEQGEAQRPEVKEHANGPFLLGNFSVVFCGDSLDLLAHGISSVRVYWRRKVGIKEILPGSGGLKDTRSKEYVEMDANNKLAECGWYKEEFDELVATINTTLRCPADKVIAEDKEISFPGGNLTITYKLDENRKAGSLVKCLQLKDSLFDGPDTMLQVIVDVGKLDSGPKPFDMIFKRPCRPIDCVDRLRSVGCDIVSQGQGKVAFKFNGREYEIYTNLLRIKDTSPHEFLGQDADQQIASSLGTVLKAISMTQV